MDKPILRGEIAAAMPPDANARRALPPLDMTGVAEWLVERGLRGLPLDDQVEGFCRRVVDAGFPARRFTMSIGTLHPRHGARSYVWRLSGLETEEFARQRSSEEREPFLRSPIHHLQSSGEVRLRRRLDTGTPHEFPVLADLREAGMTDYAARVVPFDVGQAATLRAGAITEGVDQPNPMQGIFFSCTTDVPGGFDDGQLRQVDELLPYLALAVKSRSMFEVARTLLATYLGADAGRRVLTGEIDRHSVQKIQAVIWLCDLRGFSAVANRVSHDELIEILDTYLELMARPVLDNRGQILKFLGDGFLATFDLSLHDRQAACIDALTAAEQLLEILPRFNAERRAAGKRTLDFGVALHLGEVLYGNIGSSERLDFTVVGSAVNEASRIEGLCRPLQRKVLVSSTFFEAAVASAGRMISVGVHPLRGIREPQELFTIADA
ncbi:MAG TPA: adenylate/guanylate cyclase domain-containing protein [Casimicrobiaceae bacterium]|nr:adenylate/guanylate cyclase domain-containing protein [Casimicrobiaceae bacterium]